MQMVKGSLQMPLQLRGDVRVFALSVPVSRTYQRELQSLGRPQAVRWPPPPPPPLPPRAYPDDLDGALRPLQMASLKAQCSRSEMIPAV